MNDPLFELLYLFDNQTTKILVEIIGKKDKNTGSL